MGVQRVQKDLTSRSLQASGKEKIGKLLYKRIRVRETGEKSQKQGSGFEGPFKVSFRRWVLVETGRKSGRQEAEESVESIPGRGSSQ